MLYGGAERAGLGRRRAALLAGAAAVVLGGWFTASAVIAGHGWYHTLPWYPVAAAGFLGMLLALSRIPVVARALAAPGMASRLELPHSFRVAEVAFLLYLALGHLPALFALPAGLGDIAAGIAAPLVARRLARGTGRRAALWFNAFGMTDLVVALTLGALTGFQLLNVTPSSAPITELPLALIPTVAVPLLFALHITSMSALARAPRPAAASHRPAHCRRHARGYGAKPGIPALGESTQRRGEDKAARYRRAQGGGRLAGRRPAHPRRARQPAHGRRAPPQGHPPARLYAGRRPGQRKGNAMNTRSPYPDAEVPEISQPRFVLDRADERGAAVPLMGPADPGTATPLMGPAAAGTVTPLMGPAAPATVTPLMGPADRGTMVSLMGPADPGTATPLMLPGR